MKLPRRLPTTASIAVAIATVLTLVFGYLAVTSLLGAFNPDWIDPAFGGGALSGAGGTVTDAGSAAQTASALVAGVTGAVVIVSRITVVGLVLRRRWAQEAAMVIYLMLGVIALATSCGGLTSDPPARSAWLGVLTGCANLAIVGLLFHRSNEGRFN